MPSTAETKTSEQASTWIEINSESLRNNLSALRKHQAKGTFVNAIVKANAYGHGLIPVAKVIEHEVDYLSVTSLREVQELRGSGVEAPILILSRLFESEIEAALKNNVTLMVSSLEEANNISRASEKIKCRTKIHIKVDTGMGRLGMPMGQALNDIEKISQLPALETEGLMTHFPSAEKSGGITERQIRDFSLLMQALETKDIRFPIRHAANSAGTLKVASPIFNMIRPGLMLYGIYPDITLRDFAELSPALSLKSRFMFLKRLQPGQTVGYGQDFVVKDPCTIGLLPVGYSHGYPFRAAKKAYVLFRGKKFPLAGRVSMDYIAVNLGDEHTKIGEEVTLIGRDGNERISMENIADWADTIPYEVATGLAHHIPRLIK